MRWFVVLISVINGQPVGIVEDNMPFTAPDLCWAEAQKIQANGTPGKNPVRVLCAMNAEAANFEMRGGSR